MKYLFQNIVTLKTHITMDPKSSPLSASPETDTSDKYKII